MIPIIIRITYCCSPIINALWGWQDLNCFSPYDARPQKWQK